MKGNKFNTAYFLEIAKKLPSPGKYFTEELPQCLYDCQKQLNFLFELQMSINPPPRH